MEEDTLVEALELKFLHFKCSYSIEIKEIARSTSPSLSSDSAFQSQLSCHANDMRAGERGGVIGSRTTISVTAILTVE